MTVKEGTLTQLLWKFLLLKATQNFARKEKKKKKKKIARFTWVPRKFSQFVAEKRGLYFSLSNSKTSPRSIKS